MRLSPEQKRALKDCLFDQIQEMKTPQTPKNKSRHRPGGEARLTCSPPVTLLGVGRGQGQGRHQEDWPLLITLEKITYDFSAVSQCTTSKRSGTCSLQFSAPGSLP